MGPVYSFEFETPALQAACTRVNPKLLHHVLLYLPNSLNSTIIDLDLKMIQISKKHANLIKKIIFFIYGKAFGSNFTNETRFWDLKKFMCTD